MDKIKGKPQESPPTGLDWIFKLFFIPIKSYH